MLTKTEAKYIQSLSQKKFRDEEGVYIIEGPKIMAEALASIQVKIVKIYALEEWVAAHPKIGTNLIVQVVTEAELHKISQLKTPNQVLAIARQAEISLLSFNENLLSLALDGIQDPGNLGTIIRIADWFGVQQIICSNDCVDCFNIKVVQSTMGSIFRVQLFYTDLKLWINQHPGIVLYGAALNGNPLQGFSKIKKGIIVIGNESQGIREDVMQKITQKITIEKLGEAESLNAAVATGIILSHLK